MSHYVIFTPDPDFSLDAEDWCWDGTWEWVCDCDTTESCRWTTDCDCEEFYAEVAPDGSSASHTHYRDVDEIGEDEDEEFHYPMTVAKQCQVAVWFYESDKDELMPPRPGKHEVEILWESYYYDFRYKEEVQA